MDMELQKNDGWEADYDQLRQKMNHSNPIQMEIQMKYLDCSRIYSEDEQSQMDGLYSYRKERLIFIQKQYCIFFVSKFLSLTYCKQCPIQ